MECQLEPSQVAQFARLLACLQRLGEHITIEPGYDRLYLFTHNGSFSSFAFLTLLPGFFAQYHYTGAQPPAPAANTQGPPPASQQLNPVPPLAPGSQATRVTGYNDDDASQRPRPPASQSHGRPPGGPGGRSFRFPALALTRLFRQKSQLEALRRCTMTLLSVADGHDDDAMVLTMACSGGVTKVYRFVYAVADGLRALYSKSASPNAWTVSPGVLAVWLQHFDSRLDDVTMMCEAASTDLPVRGRQLPIAQAGGRRHLKSVRRVKFKSHTEGGGRGGGGIAGDGGGGGGGGDGEADAASLPRRRLGTQLVVDPSEFDVFRVQTDVSLTFSIRDFRTILSFAERMEERLSAYFDVDGSPIVFGIKASDLLYEADFILGTLNPSHAPPDMVTEDGEIMTDQQGVNSQSHHPPPPLPLPVPSTSGFEPRPRRPSRYEPPPPAARPAPRPIAEEDEAAASQATSTGASYGDGGGGFDLTAAVAAAATRSPSSVSPVSSVFPPPAAPHPYPRPMTIASQDTEASARSPRTGATTREAEDAVMADLASGSADGTGAPPSLPPLEREDAPLQPSHSAVLVADDFRTGSDRWGAAVPLTPTPAPTAPSITIVEASPTPAAGARSFPATAATVVGSTPRGRDGGSDRVGHVAPSPAVEVVDVEVDEVAASPTYRDESSDPHIPNGLSMGTAPLARAAGAARPRLVALPHHIAPSLRPSVGLSHPHLLTDGDDPIDGMDDDQQSIGTHDGGVSADAGLDDVVPASQPRRGAATGAARSGPPAPQSFKDQDKDKDKGDAVGDHDDRGSGDEEGIDDEERDGPPSKRRAYPGGGLSRRLYLARQQRPPSRDAAG
ncbi:hypothetical protein CAUPRSCDRAFT_10748 [Caulochytrium protostelioides]|uniref:Rad9-domain-containing protein n=1 Tax=Caulochytrium protostelioides TaxID=1555241 RepID=A0A4P9WYF8_9FUNG|nr:hypothetical protein CAUPRSCDRAFT_10748 [Caulochytrium protostelioides]